MASTPFRNPAGRAGLLDNLLSLVNALVCFFEARAELVARESKTALVHLITVVACLGAAVVFFVFGYLFLLGAASAWIAQGAGISWIWVALAFAGLHFLLAIAGILIAAARMKKPLFQASAGELKKDREWLKDLNTRRG